MPEWQAVGVPTVQAMCGGSAGGPRQQPDVSNYASLLTLTSTPCYSQAPLLSHRPIL